MTTSPNTIPPGPYRVELGSTADTYRIFAAGDDKPMAELIYIGGEEDFAAAALALARLFAAGPKLLEACDVVQRAYAGDGVNMAEAVDACLLAIAEVSGGKPSRPIVIEVRGGVVVDVQNVPPGYQYEVLDHDDREEDPAGRAA